MSMIKPSARMRKLEAQLKPQKIRAAYMLLALELREKGEDGPTSIEGVAKELKVNPSTIYDWKREATFIEYKNAIADDFLLEKRAIVNKKLMSLIDTDQPSVKAIDLYFRRFGLLTERQIVEQQDTQTGTGANEDIEENIQEIDAMLEEGTE